MFALCDLNKFYASIIRVFMPEYENVPVMVLSNNDQCNICFSPGPLSSDLGIKMGTPVFEIQHLIKKYGIKTFSCNFPLISDMSLRVKSIMRRFFPATEDYSIDEIFADMSGISVAKCIEICRKIVKIVGTGLGLPISIGLAPTKTLAKVACRYAKRFPGYEGVCVIDSELKREKALQGFEIGDIWGIGDKYEKKLRTSLYKVKTAYDFTKVPRAWVRLNMTVVGEKTYRELLGTSCLELEDVAPPKKNIMVSRSFGKMIDDFDTIAEAVTTYDCMGAAKLRKQKSKAKALYVFLETNRFRQDLAQYYPKIVVKLPVATSSSIEISKYVRMALKAIYKEGYKYKKAGVMMMEISPEDSVQMNVFDPMNPADRKKHDILMKVIDMINDKWGRNTIFIAGQGTKKKWWIKQLLLCPCYTTRLNELAIAV